MKYEYNPETMKIIRRPFVYDADKIVDTVAGGTDEEFEESIKELTPEEQDYVRKERVRRQKFYKDNNYPIPPRKRAVKNV